MSDQRFSPEFKDEAVRQIVDRGYSVAEVSERLSVSCATSMVAERIISQSRTDPLKRRSIAGFIESNP